MRTLAAEAEDSQSPVCSSPDAETRHPASDVFRRLRTDAEPSAEARAALHHALIADYVRVRLAAMPAMPVLILAAAFAAMTWAPLGAVLGWSVSIVGLHALLAVACLQFTDRSRKPPSLALFVALEALVGLGWACILLLASTGSGPDPATFQLAATLVILATGTILAAELPKGALAASLPIALTAIVLFAMRQEPFYLGLAGLCLAAEVGGLALSRRLCASSRAEILSGSQKHRLERELKAVSARAEASRRIAEDANLTKSRFLAAMNHELRTPLNAILGFSEVMKDEVLGPLPNPTYREYARDIHESGGHLLSLISEILELSGFEAGRYELNEEPVQLGGLAEDCVAFVRSRVRNRGLRLVLATESDLPPILADARGTRQIMLNLLSNAIKFTPAGGEIAVHVGWTAGGGQYVSIRDTGPGIPASEMGNVLSGFGQGEAAIRKAEQGSGMGLAIVDAITRLHGGTFELRSTLGQGTEATACFPRSRVMEPRLVSAVVAEPADAMAGRNVEPLVRWRSAG